MPVIMSEEDQVLSKKKQKKLKKTLLEADGSAENHQKSKKRKQKDVNEDANIEMNEKSTPKKKKKKQKNRDKKEESESIEENNVEEKKSKKKRKKNTNANSENQNDNETEEQDELDPSNPKISKTESIRAIKRRKHELLLIEKKNKSELAMQQKCLNYLSQWKYNKDGWKFQKLLQIWLQQNIFDEVRVPEKFWDTLVEYFNNSKGKSRENILKEAVKIVDEHDQKPAEENEDDNEVEEETEAKGEEQDKPENVRYIRARHLIQFMQE